MKLQLIALSFAAILGVMVDGRELLDGKVPICTKVGDGVYHHQMMKKARVESYVNDHDAIIGRCGPENCEILCRDAKSFVSSAAGRKCECVH